MRRRILSILALAAMLIAASLVDTGFGSPNYPLRELLWRAETVLVVRMASRTETDAVFEVTQVLRGDATLQKLSLGHTRAGRDLPTNTRGLLLFSQGDRHRGKPKDSFQVGQPIKGQSAYRGWILMDGPGQSKEELERLKQLVKQNPFTQSQPDRRKAKTAKEAEATQGTTEPARQASADAAGRRLSDKTMEAVKQLKTSVDTPSFCVLLNYYGPGRGEVVDSLYLSMMGEDIDNPGNLAYAWLPKKRAVAIIDHLGELGFFDRAKEVDPQKTPPAAGIPKGPTYVLMVRSIRNEKAHCYYLDLGWNRQMLQFLDGFRKGLVGEEAKGMDKLLAQLQPERKRWQAAEEADVTPAGLSTNSRSELSARIILPETIKPVAGVFPAKLRLTNYGKQPIRLATLCQAWRSSSKGAFHVSLQPDRWKSDQPTVAQSAKSVVELSPGESTTIPFEVVDGGGETLHVTASYGVLDEFAKKLNVWSGFVRRERVVLKRVERGELRLLRSEEFPLPGTQVSIEWAFRQPQVFVVVCEAVSDAKALGFWDLLPDGVTGKSQVFKVTEVLAGETAAADDATFDYFVFDGPGAHERTIRKGERVIWVARPWIQGDVGVKGRPHCLKVLRDTPENRRAVRVAYANRRTLPGSRMPLEATIRGGFAFVAACEAIEDTQGEIGAIGKLNCTQEFQAHQLLAGDEPGVDKVRLHYTYGEVQDCRERAVRKRERVIWIVRKADEGQWIGVKAVPDTPENRKAVQESIAKQPAWRQAPGTTTKAANPVNLPRDARWSKAVNGLRAGIATSRYLTPRLGLKVRVFVQNVSKEPMAVNLGTLLTNWRVFDGSGRAVEESVQASYEGITDWRLLAANEIAVRTIGKPERNRNGVLALEHTEWKLKPGKYSLAGNLIVGTRHGARKPPQWTAWSGKIELPAVEFEVFPDDSSAEPIGTCRDVADFLKHFQPKIPDTWEIHPISVAHDGSFTFSLSQKSVKGKGGSDKDQVLSIRGYASKDDKLDAKVLQEGDVFLRRWCGLSVIVWGGGRDWITFKKDLRAALAAAEDATTKTEPTPLSTLLEDTATLLARILPKMPRGWRLHRINHGTQPPVGWQPGKGMFIIFENNTIEPGQAARIAVMEPGYSEEAPRRRPAESAVSTGEWKGRKVFVHGGGSTWPDFRAAVSKALSVSNPQAAATQPAGDAATARAKSLADNVNRFVLLLWYAAPTENVWHALRLTVPDPPEGTRENERVLDGQAAKEMDEVLGNLQPLRKEWEKAAAALTQGEADRVARLVKSLKANKAGFVLSVEYRAPQADINSPERGDHRLTFTVAPPPGPTFVGQFIQITEAQAERIIDHLAAEQLFLGRANDVMGKFIVGGPRPGCTWLVWGASEPSQPDPNKLHPMLLRQSTPASPEMLARLDGLRKVLDGDAAKAMDELLKRLEPHRKEWEKAASSARQPDVAGALLARIVLPAKVTPANGRFPAKLELTNIGKQPVRVATLCQAWPDSSKRAFHVSLRPDRWKSDRPPVEQSARSVVELSPGESTTLPFEVVDGSRKTLRVTASYAVSEGFAKELNVWSGSFAFQPARVNLERVEEGELKILLEEPGEFPLFHRGKAIVREKVSQLIEELESPDPQSRLQAIYGLAKLGPNAKEAVPALVRRLKDEDAQVRIEAANSFYKIFPPKVNMYAVFPVWIFTGGPATLELMSPEEKVEFARVTAIANEEKAKAAKVAVPALIEALTDESVYMRQFAAMSLGAFGPHARRAVRPLIGLLEDESEAVRMWAVGALGGIGPDAKEAVPKLIAYFKKYQQDRLRTPAIRSLGKIGPGAKEAVPFLIGLLQGRGESRYRVAEALGGIGPEAKAAVPALIAALEDPERLVRAYAAEALGKIAADTELIVPALMKAEKDEYFLVRDYASRALDSLTKLLGKQLHSKDWNEEAAAIRSASALIEECPKAELYKLTPLVEPLFSKVGWGGIARDRANRAAQLIARIGKPAVPFLVEKLKSPESHDRWCAIEIFGRIGEPDAPVVSVVRPMLHDEDAYVRRVAIDTLAALGNRARPAVEDLEKVLTDSTPNNRIRGHAALIRITGEAGGHIEAIAEHLKSRDMREFEASFAAATLGGFGAVARPAEPQLRAALKHPHAQVRVDAAGALGAIGAESEETIVALIGQLRKDPDPAARRSSAYALGKIGPAAKAAVPALSDILESEDVDKALRRTAAEAIKRIRQPAAPPDAKSANEPQKQPAPEEQVRPVFSGRVTVAEILRVTTPLLERSMANNSVPWGEINNGLQCRLSPAAQATTVWRDMRPREVQVHVRYDVRNAGDKALRFSPTGTPMWGPSSFEVAGPDGKDVEYVGVRSEVRPPLPPAELAPGEILRCEAKLEYDFTQPGKYLVKTRKESATDGPEVMAYYGNDAAKARQNPDNVWTGLLVSNTAVVEVLEGHTPDQPLLPGSHLTLAEACGEEFEHAAIWEAVDEADSSEYHRSKADEKDGVFFFAQKFRLVDPIVGKHLPIGDSPSPYRCIRGAGERPIAKGERVIWIFHRTGHKEGGLVGPAKALPVTFTNIEAVVDAVQGMKRWGPASSGIQAGIRCKALNPDPEPGVVLVLSIRNVGAKPVRLLNAGSFWGHSVNCQSIEVKVHGKVYPFCGPQAEPPPPPSVEAFIELPPGAVDSAEVRMLAANWGLKDFRGAEMTFVYANDSTTSDTSPYDQEARKWREVTGLWTGSARSGTIKLNAAEAQQKSTSSEQSSPIRAFRGVVAQEHFELKPIPGLAPEKLERLQDLARRFHEQERNARSLPDTAKIIVLEEELGKFLSVSDLVAVTGCQYERLSSTAFHLLRGASNATLSQQDAAKLLEHLPDRETTLAVKGLLASQVLAENERFGIPALAGVLRQSSDPFSRVHAAAGLAAEDSKADAALRREAESLLLASLGNDDDTARIAHNALPTLKPWMIEWLLERLGDAGASIAFWNNATSRLSTCNPRGFEKRLKQLFVDAGSHASVRVRINATNGLRALGLRKADTQLYGQILKDENPHVRRMLYVGLFQLKEPWAAPLLKAGLEDTLPENVGICADGLAALDHKPAVPKLIATLRRDDLGASVPPCDAHRRVGQATVKLADLEGYDFGMVGRPVGSMYSHGMKIEDRSEVYRKECTRLLNWWKTTGSGLKWDQ